MYQGYMAAGKMISNFATCCIVLLRGTCALSELSVKILAQKRVEPLHRLLSSLQTTLYPPTANVDVEIHVDQLPSEGFYLWSRRSARDIEQREKVLELSDNFVRNWSHGNARVVKLEKWHGVRGMWLACADPGLYGEEFSRFVIFEDDVELPTAWYVFPQLPML
mgnify:FL=1